jgi:limonene-1,2-epoxide hydrolase
VAWRLGLTLFVSALLLAGAAGLYAYASSLAAAPQKVMASYCAAIKRDDYHAAYSLLASSAQAQESEAQYLADASARDTIEGPVTQCSGSPTESLSPLSFLRSPRSLIFNAQISRKHAASGQIALTRDAVGWHIAALSSPLQGVDLGPLSTEQALCKAFAEHAYDQAYALLSTPYQKEQGAATTFARAFGSTLTLSGCSPDLKTYSVNSADQQATVDATLTVSVAGTSGAAPSAFTLPARFTFVREATGWRVDAITPLLNQ